MNIINILLIASVLIFIIISFIIFGKRYKENKERLQRISLENDHELKRKLEEEVREKREEELKKLEAGDKNTIIEVLDRLFKSSKLAGWVKSQTFHLHNNKTISIIVHISGQEDLVNSKKQITLKTGEVFTQNKHYLAIKKEYSEKVFQCAYKVVEESLTNIPTLYKIYISEYINEEEKDKPICVLSMEVNKDQYRAVKDKNTNVIEKLDFFKAKYNYDTRNYDFQEIEPVETPAGETSLEKTMATKASANTSFYGTAIIDKDSDPINLKKEQVGIENKNINSNTKISSLSGSMMLDKSTLNIESLQLPSEKTEETVDFDHLVKKLLEQSEFKVLDQSPSDNGEVSILAISSTRETYLIQVSKNDLSIKEDHIKELVNKVKNKNVDHGMYISNGGFALDSVQYAVINNIELFDKEKLNKLLTKF
jgi:hypothetical protein